MKLVVVAGSDSGARRLLGSELNCTPRKQGGAGGGGFCESERTSVNILNKGSFRYPGFQHTPWSIMTPSVNTRALVTLVRNAVWRERDICYGITQTSKLL